MKMKKLNWMEVGKKAAKVVAIGCCGAVVGAVGIYAWVGAGATLHADRVSPEHGIANLVALAKDGWKNAGNT